MEVNLTSFVEWRGETHECERRQISAEERFRKRVFGFREKLGLGEENSLTEKTIARKEEPARELLLPLSPFPMPFE